MGPQEQLKVFIETGKELLVKGLEGELTGISENTAVIPDRKREVTDLGDGIEDTVAKMDEGNLQTINNELNLQINEMIEKNEGVWRCKICGKTSRSNIRPHAETHIEGMSHACQICSKTFPNRHSLSSHVSYIHSELFSCDICDKTGMNKQAYRDHKR